MILLTIAVRPQKLIGARKMNERIRQLADEAGAETWSRAPMRAVTGLAFTDENLKKFAELIVAECAGIYDKIDNGNLHMGTDNYLEAVHKTFRS